MSRILLIEDDPDTGESIKSMLELTGHEVHWAHQGKEAVQILGGASVDIILTDILMPEMDGLETIQYLRRNCPQVPVVAMTAQRDTPYLRAAALFGAKHTLYKPFTIQDLEATLKKALAEI